MKIKRALVWLLFAAGVKVALRWFSTVGVVAAVWGCRRFGVACIFMVVGG